MRVRVDEAGQQHAALQIDDARGRPDVAVDGRARTDGENAITADGDRFGDPAVLAAGIDDAVAKDDRRAVLIGDPAPWNGGGDPGSAEPREQGFTLHPIPMRLGRREHLVIKRLPEPADIVAAEFGEIDGPVRPGGDAHGLGSGRRQCVFGDRRSVRADPADFSRHQFGEP